MSDTLLRSLEREALGNFDARIRLLVERMRAEVPSVFTHYRRSVELMAYCKDEAARAAIGYCCDFHLGNTHLSAMNTYTGSYNDMCKSQSRPKSIPTLLWFIKGLERWDTMTAMRAAVAASWMAVYEWEKGKEFTGPSNPMLAILTVEDWIDDPSKKNQKACGTLYPAVGLDSFAYWLLRAANGSEWREAIYHCVATAELCAKRSVREPICAALIEWCK